MVKKLPYRKDIQCIETIPMCTFPTYVTENTEENYLEIYVFQVSCPLSLHLLNIPNCQSVLNSCHFIANCLFLHDSYISKFEFMNFLFANLLVACLKYMSHALFTPLVRLDEPLLHESEKKNKAMLYGCNLSYAIRLDHPVRATGLSSKKARQHFACYETMHIKVLSTSAVNCI